MDLLQKLYWIKINTALLGEEIKTRKKLLTHTYGYYTIGTVTEEIAGF